MVFVCSLHLPESSCSILALAVKKHSICIAHLGKGHKNKQTKTRMLQDDLSIDYLRENKSLILLQPSSTSQCFPLPNPSICPNIFIIYASDIA